MMRVTRDDITKAVGPVDDVTIAEIIGTGAVVLPLFRRGDLLNGGCHGQLDERKIM